VVSTSRSVHAAPEVLHQGRRHGRGRVALREQYCGDPQRVSERQVVPVPPSQPTPQGNDSSAEPVAGTARPRPQLPWGPRNSALPSRWAGVSWSDVMRATESVESMRCPFPVPPASSMETKDQ
jgi:hypothetical protein